jgi:hypothetical protein
MIVILWAMLDLPVYTKIAPFESTALQSPRSLQLAFRYLHPKTNDSMVLNHTHTVYPNEDQISVQNDLQPAMPQLANPMPNNFEL